MEKKYMTRIAMAAALAAMCGMNAQAATWRNVNSKLAAPSFLAGWSGNLTQVNEGIGENYNGAFELYQVLADLPAGKYTLTCNAFYRYATNDLSKENMKDGNNHNAYIFLNDETKAVAGLFDDNAEGVNSLTEAKAAFEAGKYVNTLEIDHKGGDLKLGIRNLGGLYDEWTAFDNFKLTGPEGDVAIANGDFEDVDASKINWDFNNIDGSAKLPDTPLKTVQTKEDKQGEYNGKVTGVFRKSNASVYNFGTSVELEPGKYRWGVQSFFRYAGGNKAGEWITIKGGWEVKKGTSAYDVHVAGTEDPERMAYIYATDCTDDSKEKPLSKADAMDLKADGFYNTTTVKCIFDEELSAYPENEPTVETPAEGEPGWCDSGFEQESAKCFVNNPDKYRNYVEFEVKEKSLVWLGLAIDKRPDALEGNNKEYWNPARDFTLEMMVEDESGIDGIDADENAPVEYYNLQGIRVANPVHGIFIMKQGKKASKVIL